MEKLLTSECTQELKLHFNLKQMREPEKLTQIMLVSTVNGQRIRVYTKLRVQPRYWDKTICRCRTELAPNLRERSRLDTINRQIGRLRNDLFLADERLAQKGKCMSAGIFRNIVRSQQDDLAQTDSPMKILNKLVEEYPDSVNRRGKRGAESTRRTYTMALKRLENYCQQEKVVIHSLNDLDKGFFTDFATYLYSCTYQKGKTKQNYTQNTVINTQKVIKNLLHRAYDDGLMDNCDFRKVQTTLPSEVSEQIYLEEEEVQRLAALNLEGREKIVRDMFVISCYTALRISDLHQLKNAVIQDGTISLYQVKTKERVEIPILKEIAPIIMHYQQNGFPKFDSCQANRIIKQLACRCGICQDINYREHRGGSIQIVTKPKWAMVSFHTARRSCITNLYRRGYPINYIMSLSGHKTVQAFQRYMRASSKELMDNFVTLLKKEQAM